MSDLSRLLGDVYNSGTPGDADDDARSPVTTTLPDWADEEVLDEAFSNWVPGPPADAPAAERTMLSDLATGPQAERLDSEPAEVSEPAEGETGHAPEAPEPRAETGSPDAEPAEHGGTDGEAPVAAEPAPDFGPERGPAPWRGAWQRSDDDILPRRSARGRFRR